MQALALHSSLFSKPALLSFLVLVSPQPGMLLPGISRNLPSHFAPWNLVPPFVGPNITNPPQGHGHQAGSGKFSTSIVPLPVVWVF